MSSREYYQGAGIDHVLWASNCEWETMIFEEFIVFIALEAYFPANIPEGCFELLRFSPVHISPFLNKILSPG
jgi:hypothetical protein